ncbi:cell division transport system permease protein [Pustulibacterium marinum]|uniref:Cell division protein FtsX n=1 Tax=Pustulibacterium marinum TaxID=1224947 RepID=A0A1I7EX47_9FLAO|nr:permease-like cell division protein FtsX [Pustulibacterium marinum]SFU28487.1 cell division transport system permease protein [Pustulibacterium marinum]
MSTSFDKFQKRKLISSYFSVTISIALVLFLLGTLALLILNTQKLVNHFKEQVAVTVYLKETAKETEIDQLQKSLALADYTKSAEYVSKDEAAEVLMKDLGENFVEFLGDNPLQNSIDIHLKAAYVTPEQLADIALEVKGNTFVDEVSYDVPLVTLLNDNVKKISYGILIASSIVMLIAVLLINSSIRLSIYSKRFIIKTMQMVGATKSFIRRPFIATNIKLGIVGSIIAIAVMTAIMSFLDQKYPELALLQDVQMVSFIFGGIFIFGILISWLSTFFATQRFLNLRTDDLYY